MAARERRRIPRLHEHSRLGAKLLGDAADGRSDDRRPAGERLQHGERMVVRSGRVDVEIGRAEERRDALPFDERLRAQSRHADVLLLPSFAKGDRDDRHVEQLERGAERGEVLVGVRLRALGRKDDDVRAMGEADPSASLVAVSGREQLEVDTVRDHAGGDDRRRKHRPLRALEQPGGGANDMQPRAFVQLRLALPVARRPVHAQRGIAVEMGTRAAAGEPALRVEGVRAMARIEPLVVHCHDGRLPPGELRQHAQVEVAAVEVVEVEDVRRARGQADHAVRRRKAEVLAAAGGVEQHSGIAERARSP